MWRQAKIRIKSGKPADLVVVKCTTHVLAGNTLHENNLLVCFHDLDNLWSATRNLLLAARPARPHTTRHCSCMRVSTNASPRHNTFLNVIRWPYLHLKMTCTFTAPIEPSLNPPCPPLSAITAVRCSDVKVQPDQAANRNLRSAGRPWSAHNRRIKYELISAVQTPQTVNFFRSDHVKAHSVCGFQSDGGFTQYAELLVLTSCSS